MILVPISIETNFTRLDNVVFLGEWCKNKMNSNIPNAKIAEYHWNDSGKLYKDYKYINELYEVLLFEYHCILNKLHGTSHSVMFWRVIIGPWLLSFITALFDRWCMMVSAIDVYEVKSVALLDVEIDSLVPRSMEDYDSLSINDDWNSYIFYMMIQRFASLDIIKFPTKVKCTSVLNTCKTFVKKRIKHLKSSMFRPFTKANNIIFVDSYIPIIEQFKIEIKLNQFPSFFNFSESSIGGHIKDRFKLQNQCKAKNNFETFLFSIIPQQMPMSYVENYENILSTFNTLPKISSSKVIFTSNAHFSNDQFKIWCAHCKENGSKIVIGQHGGGTKSLKFDQQLDLEYAICNFYIAWGNGGITNEKNVVLPTNRLIGVKGCSARNGGLLHILDGNYRYVKYSVSSRKSSQYIEYLNEQKEFIDGIDQNILHHYKLRHYPNKYNWAAKLEVEDKNIHIDMEKNFTKSLCQSKLVISTCNQTTFLQAMAMNIPNVAFWNVNLESLNDNSILDYKKLFDVGILHFSPESAANHVNKVWSDIDSWWYDQELQNVRLEFCKKYVCTSSSHDGINQWYKFFNKLL